MLRSISTIVLTAFVALGVWGDANAGNITHLPGGMKCADLLNNGKKWCIFTIEIGNITEETVDGVKKLIAYKSQFSEPVGGSMVVLNSPGGDLNAAYEIGRIIHGQRYPATITAGARCVSACVLILAGAVQRIIDGNVGIHRPYFLSASDTNKSAEQIEDNYQSVLDVMRRYLQEMNVDVRLADQMLRIDPDRVRYLTRAELDEFGIGEGPPSVDIETKAKMKEAVALKAAEAYGLAP